MIRVHSYESMGTFDGPGLRLVVFLQGCNFRCLYCANPDTIEACGGKPTEAAEILRMAVDQKPFFGRRGGITFSGGEPTFQAAGLVPLVRSLKEAGIHVCLDSNGGVWNPAVEELLGLVDLVLLDVMLPKFDGIEVCQRIREKSSVPIIMLTAKGEDMDKILGLEYGADDYMTKPFNILEVKARIKTILRRTTMQHAETNQRSITVRDLKLNMNNRSVSVAGRDVNLTAKEFDLLQLFMTNRGKVFSRESLLETIWKYDYLGDLRTVDVHIRRLREKIEKVPSQPEYIFTKWGVGYYFTDKD